MNTEQQLSYGGIKRSVVGEPGIVHWSAPTSRMNGGDDTGPAADDGFEAGRTWRSRRCGRWRA